MAEESTSQWTVAANRTGDIILHTAGTYLDRDIQVLSIENQFKQEYICLNKESGSYTIAANDYKVVFIGSIVNSSGGQVTQSQSPVLPQPSEVISGYQIIGITGMELVNSGLNVPLYFKEAYVIDGELYVTIHNSGDTDIVMPEKSSDTKNNSYIKVLLEKVL